MNAAHENKFFHVGQKAFIWKDGKLLVLLAPNGAVDIPGGRIQNGDRNIESALHREIAEETGLVISIGRPVLTWRVDLSSEISVYLVGFECAYVSGELRISDEHSRAVWVTKETYRELPADVRHFAALEKYFESR